MDVVGITITCLCATFVFRFIHPDDDIDPGPAPLPPGPHTSTSSTDIGVATVADPSIFDSSARGGSYGVDAGDTDAGAVSMLDFSVLWSMLTEGK